MNGKDQLRKQIIQLLLVMSEGQNIIQCIKEVLVMHEQFSPVVLFETITKGKNKCLKIDIKTFLEQHYIQFNNQQLKEYMRQNRFNNRTSFQEFFDTIIPFNADALRVYKQTYIEKISIRKQNPEVELIYRELLENQFKLIRSILMIKKQILSSCQEQIWRVNQLIKTDLVGKSKIRQSKKYQQKFQNISSNVSFVDLRRFLQLHTPIHEVALLNLMRKLKADDPFNTVDLDFQRGLKILSKSKSKGKSKQRMIKNQSTPTLQNSNYDNLKKQLQNQYQASLNSTVKNRSTKKSILKKPVQNGFQKQKKNINGNLLKKLLQTIITRQQILQKQRNKLFKIKEFNMINLFKLIDSSNRGTLIAEDFTKFIKKYSQKSNVNFDYLIDKFTQADNLKFKQLFLVFQPLSEDYVKIVSDKQQNPVANPFKQKTIQLIIQILTLTTQTLKQIYKIKQLINDKCQNIQELFSLLDFKKSNKITISGIKQLLQEDQFFTDQKDMKLLFKYFGKKVEETIQFQDFKRFIDI